MPSPEEHREEALAKEAWGGGNGAGSSRLVGLEGNFGKLPLVGVTVGGRMGFAVGFRRGSAVGFTVGCGMGFAVGLAATLGLSSRTRAFSWLSVAAGFCCCTIGSFVGFRLGWGLRRSLLRRLCTTHCLICHCVNYFYLLSNFFQNSNVKFEV